MLCGLQWGIIRYLLRNNTIRKPYVSIIHIRETRMRGREGLWWNVIVR